MPLISLDILHEASTETAQKIHYPPANHHVIHLYKYPGPNHQLSTGADDPTL